MISLGCSSRERDHSTLLPFGIYDRNVQGIRRLDTRELSAMEVAKEICKIIHLEDYDECDLQGRLEKIAQGTVKPKKIPK